MHIFKLKFLKCFNNRQSFKAEAAGNTFQAFKAILWTELSEGKLSYISLQAQDKSVTGTASPDHTDTPILQSNAHHLPQVMKFFSSGNEYNQVIML